MNLQKNRTLVTIVVIFVAIGLVAAYIPFLFPQRHRQPQPTGQASPPAQTATLAPPLVEVEEVVTSSPDVVLDSLLEDSNLETVLPEGFGGLEEENESLGELDSLLEGLE